MRNGIRIHVHVGFLAGYSVINKDASKRGSEKLSGSDRPRKYTGPAVIEAAVALPPFPLDKFSR